MTVWCVVARKLVSISASWESSSLVLRKKRMMRA